MLDSLNAERAFFHDPFAANGDIGIQLQTQWIGPFPVEPVEAPYFVRTVLGAKAGSDAAVVNLVVEALFRMVGGIHRAHRFARCIVAVLTHHGEKRNFFPAFRILITFHPQPCHFTALNNPFYAHHADVVLGVARCRTGAASNAFVEIHRHAPTIGVMVMGGIEISLGIVALGEGEGKRKVFHGQTVFFMGFFVFEFIQGNREGDFSTMLDPTAVGMCQFYSASGCPDRYGAGRTERTA